MSQARLGALAAACAFAAGWAAYLAVLHQQAVAHTLEPGILCSADAGCEEVMASAWSTVGGVAVSGPAVGLFGGLAIVAVLAIAGRVSAERAASLAVASAGGGLLFGGFLLYHMLADVQHVCRYCLIMDASTLAVLIAGVMAHPAAQARLLADLVAIPSRLASPGPEWAVPIGAIVGFFAIGTALPEPKTPTGPVNVVVEHAGAPTPPPPTGGTAEKTAETRRVVIPAEVMTIPVGSDVPTKGPATAPITIALFEDFQCPFCRGLAGTMDAFQRERPDQVRIAYFHFPMNLDCNGVKLKQTLHPDACNASSAGVCAEKQGKFWELHDVLFQNTGRLGMADLNGYARDVGLDMAAFSACMADPATIATVKAQADIGVKAGVTGTPGWFVNGRQFSGGQPIEVVRAVVDAIAATPTDRVLLDVPIEGEIIGDPAIDAPTAVTLTGPRGPFTIDAFEASIVDGKAVSKPGVEPARGVTWFQAKAACEAAGKRLCQEDEWLDACTGTLPVDDDKSGIYSDDKVDGRPYPYGTFPQPTWCATWRERTDARPLTAGVHPRCVTPEGVYDLEGNTKEWIGASPDRAGLKGGSYFSRESARCGYYKDTVPPDTSDPANGFRCCSGPASTVADHHPGGKVGDPIRDFTVPLVAGGTVSPADLRGKPFVMTFWASWCGPCRKELPALAEMYAKYQAQGFTVLAINVDAEVAKAQGFLKQNPLPFLVGLDTTTAIESTFDTRELPTAFWVTKSGQIRQRTVGYDENNKGEMEANVQALIAAP